MTADGDGDGDGDSGGEEALTRVWPERTTIPGADGRPKLYRYYLLGSGKTFGLFLHRFVASDDETEMHDHPWGWGVGVVFAGGYREERRKADGSSFNRWLGIGRFNLIRGDDFHRVELRDGRPAWTLFVHGSAIKTWSFLSIATGAMRRWTQSPSR